MLLIMLIHEMCRAHCRSKSRHAHRHTTNIARPFTPRTPTACPVLRRFITPRHMPQHYRQRTPCAKTATNSHHAWSFATVADAENTRHIYIQNDVHYHALRPRSSRHQWSTLSPPRQTHADAADHHGGICRLSARPAQPPCRQHAADADHAVRELEPRAARHLGCRRRHLPSRRRRGQPRRRRDTPPSAAMPTRQRCSSICRRRLFTPTSSAAPPDDTPPTRR